MPKSKLKLGLQTSSSIRSLIIPCYFESTSKFRGKINLTINFKKFLFLPDMAREEEETSTADTRDEETTPEDV